MHYPLTKERAHCSIKPHCSKHIGQSDVKKVLSASLQSHDVKDATISHNQVQGGVIKKNSDINWVIWILQVELHTRTAHWDVISGAQFRGRSSDTGRD